MREKPKIVSLTETAAERIRNILSDKEGFLRVGVKNGGCAGMEYMLDYVTAPEKYDEVIEDKGVTILIEAKAVLFLFGTQIDWQETQFSSKFTFHNPNQTDACGCGESVTIQPLEKLVL